MNYPIGYPFSELFARLGFNLIVRVDIVFDEDASEVKEAITTLMTLNKQNPVHNADLIYKNHIALA